MSRGEKGREKKERGLSTHSQSFPPRSFSFCAVSVGRVRFGLDSLLPFITGYLMLEGVMSGDWKRKLMWSFFFFFATRWFSFHCLFFCPSLLPSVIQEILVHEANWKRVPPNVYSYTLPTRNLNSHSLCRLFPEISLPPEQKGGKGARGYVASMVSAQMTFKLLDNVLQVLSEHFFISLNLTNPVFLIFILTHFPNQHFIMQLIFL